MKSNFLIFHQVLLHLLQLKFHSRDSSKFPNTLQWPENKMICKTELDIELAINLHKVKRIVTEFSFFFFFFCFFHFENCGSVTTKRKWKFHFEQTFTDLIYGSNYTIYSSSDQFRNRHDLIVVTTSFLWKLKIFE